MSHIANSITIVCYDITSNRLRRRIDKCMKDFGVRIQYSVFLCKLDADGVERCRVRLQNILENFADEEEPSDSLIIFERFSKESMDCLLGKSMRHNMSPFLIV